MSTQLLRIVWTLDKILRGKGTGRGCRRRERKEGFRGGEWGNRVSVPNLSYYRNKGSLILLPFISVQSNLLSEQRKLNLSVSRHIPSSKQWANSRAMTPITLPIYKPHFRTLS
ncbi:hypothetical protein RND81_14G097800 [Saponaria officinalis]|uniref:Uncharacterized protein n=1 Tax=Saponaria officinalis TaxID=3572 RepID=A0AAW1GL62_SAPOF